MYDHEDPTAWQAIANVERERKRKEREARRKHPEPRSKPDRKDPPDWHTIIASEHKKVCINRAWMFYSEMVRITDERRKKT